MGLVHVCIFLPRIIDRDRDRDRHYQLIDHLYPYEIYQVTLVVVDLLALAALHLFFY